jgi:hypothetical protein
MKTSSLLFMLLVSIFLPFYSYAIPYTYNVSGQFSVNNGTGLETVTGTMTISDVWQELVLFDGPSYYFAITNCNLSLTGDAGNYNIFSDQPAGNIFWAGPMYYPNGSIAQFSSIGWNLGNGIWMGTDYGGTLFYDASGSLYDPTSLDHWGELAALITLGGPLYGSPEFGQLGGGTITLSESAPVPEPTTIFLLGAGMAGIFFVRKKTKS